MIQSEDKILIFGLFLLGWIAIMSLVYCITDISPNNLYKFSSAALSSIDVATATPHSSALQTENLSCVI